MVAMSMRPSSATDSRRRPGASAVGPLVSVIIPAFNAAATLEQTLRSVAEQTYRNLEILIVDDGSTDGTARIAEHFCARESRARLLRKENGGVASARNHALALARGVYVAPVDADDLWHPAKIARQVASALTAAEPLGFVYCWFRDIDPAGRVWRDGPPLTVLGRGLQRLACFNFVGNGSGPLFSRRALLAVGGYDERLREQGAQGCEDLLVQLAVARLHSIALVPEYLVGYRLTPNSMSADPDRMHRSWRRALELLDDAPELSRRALRWSEAARLLLLAETHAWRREPAPALRMLARAVRLDPLRAAFHLLCRTARHIGRSASSTEPDRRPFRDYDPARPSPLTDIWLRRLARFEQRRLDRIEAWEHRRAPAVCQSMSAAFR